MLMLERQRSWKIVEALETHREERQMEENSLHNQHNIVNFLLEVSSAGHATKLFDMKIQFQRAKLADFLPKVTAADVTR